MSRIKTVLSALAILSMVGQGWALEIDLSKIKVDGAVELRGHQVTNETDFNDKVNDNRSVTRHRLSLGVGGQLTDGVMTRVEVLRLPAGVVSQFGGQGLAGTGQNLNGEQSNLTVENAFMSFDDVVWGIGAKVGRMYWGSANSLVGFAGKYDDDSLTGFGVDGVVLNKSWEMFNFNYSQLTMSDTKATLTAVDPSVTKSYLKAVTIGTNIKDLSNNDKADVPVSLGIYNATNEGASGAAGNNVNMGVYELTAGVNLMENMLHLGFDWGSNFGQRNVAGAAATTSAAKVKFKGSLLSLKGSFNHEESGFGAWAEMASASGDDNTAEPDTSATQKGTDDKAWHDLSAFGLAPHRHYGEILGKSNTLSGTPVLQGLDTGSPIAAGAAGQGRGLKVLALGVSYVPQAMDKKWKLGLDYITAETSKIRPTTATAAAGLTASATDATGAKKDIGSEIDLHATYAKSENVAFKVGYASFSPEKLSAALGTNPTDDKVVKYFANANVRF